MCGRYVFDNSDALEKRFKVHVPKSFKPNYNTAPTQVMPVIRSKKDDSGEMLDMMRWGLIPSWSKDKNIGYKLFNARSETVFEKPSWRSAIKQRRCVIPATGFYEWQHEGVSKKQPYFITLKDGDLISFAGIWESWTSPEGENINTYSILTTTPNKEMAALHDRMPVILHENDEELWIHEDDKDFIEQVMRPYEDGSLNLVSVSTDVNTVKINDNHLILPTNSR